CSFITFSFSIYKTDFRFSRIEEWSLLITALSPVLFLCLWLAVVVILTLLIFEATRVLRLIICFRYSVSQLISRLLIIIVLPLINVIHSLTISMVSSYEFSIVNVS